MFAGHAIFFRRCKNIKTTSYQKIIKIVRAVFEIIAKNVEKWPFSTFFGLFKRFFEYSGRYNTGTRIFLDMRILSKDEQQ
tara:strand:+ start:195 stop:434 length:240 start_codon:yes stop_codon:yes gene_type:complete